MFKVKHEGEIVEINEKKLDDWVEYFKENRVAVHCDTEGQSKVLMILLDYKGIKWGSGDCLVKGDNNWYSYKSNTCYRYNNNESRGLMCSDLSYYVNQDYKIFDFYEFLTEIKNMITIEYNSEKINIDKKKLDELVEKMRQDRIVVNCKTEEQAEIFTNLLDKTKYPWNYYKLLWVHYKEYSCYKIGKSGHTSYAGISFYKDKKYIIVSFNDFLNDIKENKECEKESMYNLLDIQINRAGIFEEFFNKIIEGYSEPEEFKYHFKDDDIDFRKVCHDALEDDAPGWIVIGNDKAYVGLIHSGKEVGIPVMPEDFTYHNKGYMNYISDYPYGIFEIPKENIHTWMKKVKQYCKDYKEHRRDLDSKIKDRDRVKGNNTFKVIQYR